MRAVKNVTMYLIIVMPVNHNKANLIMLSAFFLPQIQGRKYKNESADCSVKKCL